MGTFKAGAQPGLGDFAPGARLHLAQSAEPTFFVEDITGISGTAVPVRIRIAPRLDEPSGAAAIRRYLVFRGIPEELSLSAGFRTRTIWIVSSADAADLKLNIPPNYRGSLSLVVLLDRSDAGNPEKQSVSVQISPPPTATVPDSVATASSPAQTAAAKGSAAPTLQTPAVAKEEEEMLGRGQSHLRQGNVVFARVLFEELAVRGSAQGAFAMAQTFDPELLEQLHVVGVPADLEKAKYWYRKAAELGNSPPVDILSSLKKGPPQE